MTVVFLATSLEKLLRFRAWNITINYGEDEEDFQTVAQKPKCKIKDICVGSYVSFPTCIHNAMFFF